MESGESPAGKWDKYGMLDTFLSCRPLKICLYYLVLTFFVALQWPFGRVVKAVDLNVFSLQSTGLYPRRFEHWVYPNRFSGSGRSLFLLLLLPFFFFSVAFFCTVFMHILAYLDTSLVKIQGMPQTKLDEKYRLKTNICLLGERLVKKDGARSFWLIGRLA